jgi:hypothetical protein
MTNRHNRKIHLDFHTPYWVKQVGQDFDAEALVQTWKQAHVNAVTVVFGLCACGNAYYKSPAAPVHPGLQKDLLKPLLPAAKREGIDIYVHFAPGINDRAVIENPEWAMVTRDGKPLLPDTDGRKWGWVCFNSPWVVLKFLPQLDDFVPRFPDVAGVFLDMTTYPPGTCYCEFCRSKAQALGLDLHRDEDMSRLWHISLTEFLEKARAIVKKHQPNMGFTCNNQWYVGGPKPHLQDWIELEAPVSWNSYHFAVMSRYLRTLPIASLGMTTRFPINWGYFGSLNNIIQLKYENAAILATLGANCIGDHLPASGKPEQGAYALIGEAFAFVEEREEWALDAKTVPYIAILADDQRVVRGRMADRFGHQTPEALYGAGLALLEGNRHFDVIDERCDLKPYKLIWLAENKALSQAAAERVRDFVAAGGQLLVTGSGLWRNEGWRELLEQLADVRCLGFVEANWDGKGEFIEPLPPLAEKLPIAPMKVKGAFVRLEPGARAIKLATAYRPYEGIERRYGHFHAPAGDEADTPGAVSATYGKGNITVIAAALAEDYFAIGSRNIRQLTMNAVDYMLKPQERLVEVDAQTPAIEVSLMSKPGQWILHLTQYNAKRHSGHTVIEEIPLRYRIPVTLRPPAKPQRVYLAPTHEEIPWTWDDGRLDAIVPELHIHLMIVLEF